MTTTRRSHKRSKELPKNAKLVKRRLPRPLPPPRLSADPKVVYVSARTPFVSAVKRVRKALEVFKDQAKVNALSNRRQNRAAQRRQPGVQSKQPRFHEPAPPQSPATKPADERKKYVTIKASGKAIEKGLALALYFQGQKDTSIEIHTGTVECRDDVVVDQMGDTFEDLMRAKEKAEGRKDEENAMDVDVDVPDEIDDDGEDSNEFAEIDDVFPSRTRNTSVIEVIVRNKVPG